jgi:hypothetical protein
MKSLRFDVFGREVLVTASDRGWLAFYPGTDEKARPATDIVLPTDIAESDIEQYLGDLCHEWATHRSPSVKRLD